MPELTSIATEKQRERWRQQKVTFGQAVSMARSKQALRVICIVLDREEKVSYYADGGCRYQELGLLQRAQHIVNHYAPDDEECI